MIFDFDDIKMIDFANKMCDCDIIKTNDIEVKKMIRYLIIALLKTLRDYRHMNMDECLTMTREFINSLNLDLDIYDFEYRIKEFLNDHIFWKEYKLFGETWLFNYKE